MIVLIRGGGDLASGVALRLYRSGLQVIITELAEPLAVRRLVSFSEAVYTGEMSVEGVTARRVTDPADSLRILQHLSKGRIPVLIDPDANSARTLHPGVIVDARMLKRPPEPLRHSARLYIGLGPGFTAGENCHAVIETQRGHTLGRVIWQGSAQVDSRLPESVGEVRAERVLRAPRDGLLTTRVEIGARVNTGQVIAEVDGQLVCAAFDGILRGLLRSGLNVLSGMKIGDLDPRIDPILAQGLCTLVSDKALAIGGGVLEAILARAEIRPHLWSK
jgi:xanthine dehydrogenase accessory factor